MHPTFDEIRRLTHALRFPDGAIPAMDLLRGCDDIAAIEGLIEQIYFPHAAKSATMAIATLAEVTHPLILDALADALASEHASVRLAALQSLHDRRAEQVDNAVHDLLRTDASWLVRRTAVTFLADRPEPARWFIVSASDDPHWRVRHALVQACLRLGQVAEPHLADVEQANPHVRRAGVLAYLRYRWTGEIVEVPAPVFAFPVPNLWDWDVAVLHRNLDRLGDTGRRAALNAMPILLGHKEERIRNVALGTLRAHGGPGEIAESIRLLDDLRIGAGESVHRLLAALHLDRKEAVARWIFELTDPSPAQRAWAAEQIGKAVPRDEAPAHALTWQAAILPSLLRGRGVGGEGAGRSETNPLVRAATLTPERAAALVADPLLETSWHVLAEAARIARVPFWKLEPPPFSPAIPQGTQTLSPPAPLPRVHGSGETSRLGISGHYGLPVEGFVRAVEAGVNLLFWEPNYLTLTAFYQRLSAADRHALHLIAGTFEADRKRIRRDVERVLRSLRIEHVGLFMLFWVQTWDRVDDEVRQCLDDLTAEGKIAAFGLSTHNRTLAVEAMETGWNPVMVRHSAAHRGAEERIFPRAAELGVSLITFNNTCYSRLLRPSLSASEGPSDALRWRSGSDHLSPPSAADCYRYAMSMPAVRTCLSAPATLVELEENLEVLRDPELPADRRAELLRFGEMLYREERTFHKLVRSL